MTCIILLLKRNQPSSISGFICAAASSRFVLLFVCALFSLYYLVVLFSGSALYSEATINAKCDCKSFMLLTFEWLDRAWVVIAQSV